MVQLVQPIMVNRDCPDSRKATIAKITERVEKIRQDRRSEDGLSWSRIIIFPEGTCTNGSQLISFKPGLSPFLLLLVFMLAIISGAFYPQLPVQPVCLKWPKNPDLISWTWDGVGLCVAPFFVGSNSEPAI